MLKKIPRQICKKVRRKSNHGKKTKMSADFCIFQSEQQKDTYKLVF
jgi:hypothetical protein